MSLFTFDDKLKIHPDRFSYAKAQFVLFAIIGGSTRNNRMAIPTVDSSKDAVVECTMNKYNE